MSIIQIKNLTVHHKKDLRPLLLDFSFTLNEGERAVIISEEGNGKSTLLKLIYDASFVSDYVEYTGEILTQGRILAYLPQEFPADKKEMSVYDYCLDTPAFLEQTPRELAALAASLRFPKDFFYSDQPTGTLSGGEKVKLQIALLCMMQPDAFLLDEPSNDIDIETLEWLETFLNTCGKSVLYVSHDETLIERTASVIIHLEQVKRKTQPRTTVVHMPYREYMQNRQDAFCRQEQLAANERREYQKQMERFRRIEQKVESMQANISRQDPHGGRLLKKKMKAVKSQERRFEKDRENMTDMPDMEQAIFVKIKPENHLPAGKTVLDFTCDRLIVQNRVLAKDVALRVMGPEKICIIGRNGIGKTTLLKQIADLLLPRADLKVSYMPQDYADLLPEEQTPVEFLTRTGDKEELTTIRTYLGSMHYTADEMSHRMGELSGGQKAKLLFLKMSLEGADCLILDEPTRNFSPLSGPVIRQVLQEFPGAIISISHDRKYIRDVCTKVYQLTENGLLPAPPPVE